uniref:Uncharacterized protein n=1 Tax=Pyramimonas orientalis virus TaxID=455367 RepID=A0A7M3UNZ8_POV01|nr:hypothetical protein HWQ62_00311 [Pyramimonas orientalis virus]
MKKEECVNLFNVKLKEFINDLITVYPHDDDLYKFKTSISMLLLVNDKQVIKIFKDFVYPKYKDRILSRDEKFFLNHDYTDDVVATQNTESPEFTDQLIVKIKSYWKTMTDENKNIIWSYFNLLIKLVEKYINM